LFILFFGDTPRANYQNAKSLVSRCSLGVFQVQGSRKCAFVCDVFTLIWSACKRDAECAHLPGAKAKTQEIGGKSNTTTAAAVIKQRFFTASKIISSRLLFARSLLLEQKIK
jgi:hypothetical protein